MITTSSKTPAEDLIVSTLLGGRGGSPHDGTPSVRHEAASYTASKPRNASKAAYSSTASSVESPTRSTLGIGGSVIGGASSLVTVSTTVLAVVSPTTAVVVAVVVDGPPEELLTGPLVAARPLSPLDAHAERQTTRRAASRRVAGGRGRENTRA